MRHIFISYAREDHAVAERLARVLESRGWRVFWDRTLVAGADFEAAIQAALDEAGCVVALWSRHSVRSDWVIDEVEQASRRDVLVPALIDDVRVPLGFRGIDTANLIGWAGDPHDQAIERLADAVEATLRRSDVRYGAIVEAPADDNEDLTTLSGDPGLDDTGAAGPPPPAAEPAEPSAPSAPAPSKDRGLPLPSIPLPGRKRRAKPAPGPGEREGRPVSFTAYHPKELRAGDWHTLLAYVHTPYAASDIEKDSRVRLREETAPYGAKVGKSREAIVRGTRIDVVPTLAGCRFNPERSSVDWLEDWHRVEFRVQAIPGGPESRLGQAVNGQVAFWVGPLLIGEVPIWSYLAAVDAPVTEPDAGRPSESARGGQFRAVFPSYSHRDREIVDLMEAAYEAVDLEFLRDLRVLRAGSFWNEVLLRKIEEADLFMLYWSDRARSSEYVEQEWRHALALGRADRFVRPMYWEEPRPGAPPELEALQFTRLQLPRPPSGLRRWLRRLRPRFA